MNINTTNTTTSKMKTMNGGINSIIDVNELLQFEISVNNQLLEYGLNPRDKEKIKNIIVNYYRINEIIRIGEHNEPDDITDQIIGQIEYSGHKSRIENLQDLINTLDTLITDYDKIYINIYQSDADVIENIKQIIRTEQRAGKFTHRIKKTKYKYKLPHSCKRTIKNKSSKKK